MANSALDDVLSMIDMGDDAPEATPSTKPAGKSSQQSLRDRMLNESNANAAANARAKEQAERERQLSEEIVEEEIEEENKPALNPKILIGVGVMAAIIVVILIAQFMSKGKKEPEAPPEEITQVEPIIEDEPQEMVFQQVYTVDQMNMLRDAGATSEQIQMWQDNGIMFEYVYYTTLERYYGWQLANTLPTYDLASDAYQEVISDTWMALPKRTDLEEWSTEGYLATHMEMHQNLDYEKIEPYGSQLFLKVYLDADSHDSWFFLNITPEEWNALDDRGNVVVDYTYDTHYKPYENLFEAEEDTENIFITGATLDIIESLKNQNKNNQ